MAIRLGIVGHAANKFTEETKAEARDTIVRAIGHYLPSAIVSGRSPMGGIDVWAEEIATTMGIPTIIHPPTVKAWDGPGGFKERNLKIAEDADRVMVIVVKDYPPRYSGMRFEFCYHCQKRNPHHVKSGGCWTAWHAKRREWIIL